MKYRILSNDHAFRVQWRPRFWPFWIWLSKVNEGGGSSIEEFATIEAAEKHIGENTDIKDWKVVKETT